MYACMGQSTASVALSTNLMGMKYLSEAAIFWWTFVSNRINSNYSRKL